MSSKSNKSHRYFCNLWDFLILYFSEIYAKRYWLEIDILGIGRVEDGHG